jgi:hypothetical protein
MPARVLSAQEGSGVGVAASLDVAAGVGLANAADGVAAAAAVGDGGEVGVELAAHPPTVRISAAIKRRRAVGRRHGGVILHTSSFVIGPSMASAPDRLTPRRR